MNKVIIALIAVLGVIVISVFAYTNYSNVQHQKRIEAMASQLDSQPVYSTVEINLTGNGRDIHLKGVLEFPNAERCTKVMQSHSSMFDEDCSAGEDCTSPQIVTSCVSYVDAKYKDMLDKKPMGITYAHVVNAKVNSEKAVMAFWGLTNAEASQLCQELISDKTADEIDECI